MNDRNHRFGKIIQALADLFSHALHAWWELTCDDKLLAQILVSALHFLGNFSLSR